ncbi:MAG: hypothetical protein ACXADU_07225 [Promethearchaeota archaeon]|jgi:uncharacterized coiled-coil protein SlyX
MSDEDLRDQINRIAVEIQQIEDVAKKKEVYINNKICEELDPRIEDLEVKLQGHKKILNELNEKIQELELKKKELTQIIKHLEQDCNDLKREKEKTLTNKLKLIAKEKKTKTKAIDKEIKILEKELKSIQDK